MADANLDSEDFYLFDLLPGKSNPVYGEPLGGFDGSTSHDVVAAAYDVGTKIQVYNETAGVAGYSTFVYGKLAREDAARPVLARHVCVMDAATPTPFEFTNGVGEDLGAGLSPAVIPAATLTVLYYGWWWCGGVCPEDWASDCAGAYYTDGNAAIGPLGTADLATPGTTAGEIGFAATSAAIATVGWAYVANA